MDEPDEPSPPPGDGTDDVPPTVTVTVAPRTRAETDAPPGALAIGPGTTIGRYVVVELIGKGAMGSVWKAHDPQLHRHVALKRVRVRAEVDGARARERLIREAQALAQLSHPNVVAVHDVVLVGDDLFIAMELVEGETLRRWLASHPGEVRAIVEVFLDAGAGLAAAHRAGLVHRDFKPDNVIVGVDGRARVVDFGVARAVDGPTQPGSQPGPLAEASGDGADTAPADRASTTGRTRGEVETPTSQPSWLGAPLTVEGARVGTPRYMAPEQHAGKATDARSDQFGFCVALYEALWEARPFPADSVAELRRKVLAGEIAPPPATRRVPTRWRRAILRGLAVDPAARWPSMEALLAELRRDRAAAWRRGGLALAAGAAVGITIAAVAGTTSDGPPSCAAAGAAVAEVWSPAARERLRAAFTASRLPYAADVLARTEHRWDELAGHWQAMRVEACEATRRGAQSTELLDRRMSCLDRRLTQMRGLLAALSGPLDRRAIDGAVQAVGALGDLSGCSREALLAQAGGPAVAPARRAQVDAALATLDRAQVLDLTGKFADARTMAGQAVEQARAAADPGVLAAALHLRGIVEEHTGAYDSADASWLDGLRAAAAARDTRRIVQLWTDRAGVANERQQALDRARAYAQAAEIVLALTGEEPTGELHRTLAERRAYIHASAGAFDLALADAEHAATSAERLYGPDDPRLGRSLSTLGQILMKRGEYARAEATLTRAMSAYERSLGPGHPNLTTPLVNLAGVLTYQRKHAAAEAAYRRALQIDEGALGPEHPFVADDRTNLAGALIAQERWDEAEPLLTQALAQYEHLRGPDAPDLAWALGGMAEIRTGQGRFEDARALLARARAIVERNEGADSEAAAQLQEHLGVTWLREGQLPVARRQLERALAMFERRLGPDHARLVIVLTYLAETGLAAGDPAAALRHAERALALSARPGVAVDEHARAWVEILRAQARHALGVERAAQVAAVRAALAHLDPVADRRHHEAASAWLRTAGAP